MERSNPTPQHNQVVDARADPDPNVSGQIRTGQIPEGLEPTQQGGQETGEASGMPQVRRNALGRDAGGGAGSGKDASHRRARALATAVGHLATRTRSGEHPTAGKVTGC